MKLCQVKVLALPLFPSTTNVIDMAKLIKKLFGYLTDVDARDDQGRTALMDHSAKGRLDMMKLALAQGANPNLLSAEGKTALIEAIEGGKLEAVKLLLEKGANINTKDGKGHTALMISIQCGYQEIARWLVLNGANVNLGFPTPLMLARQRQDSEIVELLKGFGAR